MQHPYYDKNDLIQISIKKYLGADKIISELVDDINSDFVLDNADIFRQGICQLFAYALKEKFKYPVYSITGDGCFHIFCKSEDRRYYIDVRGVTSDFVKFISGLEGSYTPTDNSKLYSFVEEDFTGKYHDIGLRFARAIIEADVEKYQL